LDSREIFFDSVCEYVKENPKVRNEEIINYFSSIKNNYRLALITTNIESALKKILGVANLKDFFDITETFDFIMFHHSFEHMDAPEKVFQHIYKLLNKGSYALIRIPVADSSSFKKYGANWVNLDPPRHFFYTLPKACNYWQTK
jgi:SAM-dependent methyltransferase